jgi:N-acetylglucosamine kinase-like BadF-type ATPase
VTKLIVGIDGGQTSVKAAVADANGRVLGEGAGGGLVHLSATGSDQRFVRHVGDAMRAAWQAAGLAATNQPEVAAIALGLTGVEGGSREADIVRELLPQFVSAAKVDVQNDAVGALVGAFENEPGIIAISGTGSIVLGQNAAGTRARAGGWGWLVGDEGSALAIGRNGLRAALAHADQSGPRTLLHDKFLAYFGIANFGDVKRVIYASDFGSRGFAGLAAVVSEAARADDAVAFDIIRNEAIALAGQVIAVARRLGLKPDATRVAPMSGGFANIFGLRESFAHAFAIIAPGVQVVEPRSTALQGVVWMAKKLLT